MGTAISLGASGGNGLFEKGCFARNRWERPFGSERLVGTGPLKGLFLDPGLQNSSGKVGTARRPKHSSKNGPSLAGRGGGGGGERPFSFIVRREDRLELQFWGTSTPFQAMDDEYNDHFRPGEDLDGEDEDQVWRQILPTQEDEIALAAMFAEDQQDELVQSFVAHEEGEQAGGGDIQELSVAPPQEAVDEEMHPPIVLRWDAMAGLKKGAPMQKNGYSRTVSCTTANRSCTSSERGLIWGCARCLVDAWAHLCFP